jgi:hypothetical protein
MNPERLLSRHPQGNGLTLELWDHSRSVAGDRWHLALEARIGVPVEAANVPPALASAEAEVRAALGPDLIFSQKDERNFIAAPEVPRFIQEMASRALDLADHYFGHPDFPRRFIAKKYAEYLHQRSWQASQSRTTEADPGSDD